VVAGGTVRYRIYSAHGLDAIEVAKLCFLTGLTFWLGNAAVLGIAIAIEPQAATALLGSSTLVETAIGIVDLLCCTAAMYLRLPVSPAIVFVTLAVVIVWSPVATTLSHLESALRLATGGVQ
jgi:hypothetical protein